MPGMPPLSRVMDHDRQCLLHLPPRRADEHIMHLEQILAASSGLTNNIETGLQCGLQQQAIVDKWLQQLSYSPT